MRIGPFVVPSIYAVHASAGLLGLVILIVLIRGALVRDVIVSCADRFEHGTVYGLETRTGLLTPVELQGALAGRDYGVMENLDIVRFKEGPANSGIRVRLAALDQKSTTDGRITNGVDFSWSPRRFPKGTTACLSYSVRVPQDFKPAGGGRLPSLVGAPSDTAGELRTIAANLVWSADGTLLMDVKSEPPGDGVVQATNVLSDVKLQPGRWMRIDQEVVLNTPGKPDGAVRLWVDGSLRLKSKGIVIRRNPKTLLDSVAITVAYTSAQVAHLTPATVEVSPFELRWP